MPPSKRVIKGRIVGKAIDTKNLLAQDCKLKAREVLTVKRIGKEESATISIPKDTLPVSKASKMALPRVAVTTKPLTETVAVGAVLAGGAVAGVIAVAAGVLAAGAISKLSGRQFLLNADVFNTNQSTLTSKIKDAQLIRESVDDY